MSAITDYPSASPDADITVIGVQDGDSRRLTLPPEVSYQSATRAEARARTAENRIITPSTLGEAVDPLVDEIGNFWSGWTTNTVVSATKANTLFNQYAGAPLSAGTDIRTGSLGTYNASAFSDTQTGQPSLAGDTLRFGMVGGNTTWGRLAIAVFDTAGSTLWELSTGEWVRVVSPDNLAYSHHTTGYAVGADWYALPPTLADLPSGNTGEICLLQRGAAGVSVVSLAYESGDNPFTLVHSARTFQAPAANITFTQIKTLVEGATGNDRIDASSFKNVPQPGGGAGVPNDDSVATAKIQDSAVVNDKVADGTLALGKLNTSGIQEGYVIKKQGDTAVWAADSVLDALPDRSVRAGALQDDSVGNRALTSDSVDTGNIKDNAVVENKVNSGALVARHYSNNSVGLAALDPTGGAAGQAYGIDANGNPAFIAVGGGGGGSMVTTLPDTRADVVYNGNAALTLNTDVTLAFRTGKQLTGTPLAHMQVFLHSASDSSLQSTYYVNGYDWIKSSTTNRINLTNSATNDIKFWRINDTTAGIRLAAGATRNVQIITARSVATLTEDTLNSVAADSSRSSSSTFDILFKTGSDYVVSDFDYWLVPLTLPESVTVSGITWTRAKSMLASDTVVFETDTAREGATGTPLDASVGGQYGEWEDTYTSSNNTNASVGFNLDQIRTGWVTSGVRVSVNTLRSNYNASVSLAVYRALSVQAGYAVNNLYPIDAESVHHPFPIFFDTNVARLPQL